MPHSVSVKSSGAFQTYDVIGTGEIRVPKGQKLDSFSWSGILPGSKTKQYRFIKSHLWREPKEIQTLWTRWKDKGAKLKLMITETPVNQDVYLDNFRMDYSGGNGDYQYSLSLIAAKPLTVYTVSELNIRPAAASNQTAARPAPAPTATYTVKSGDCLWTIAQRHLGKGSRYTEIYDLNRDKISNPSLIYPGQVLTMPS